jgi:3-hydroxyacyl-CoA dehydrogenase
MVDVVRSRHGTVECIRFANPPLNVLSIRSGLVAALYQAIEQALADPAVERIVLAGAHGVFSAGADIGDFEGAVEKLDELRTMLLTLENAPKPVIAAIEGHCLGGGLELALAAHYRVAAAHARFAFPEVTLGLLPGAGGTQRAPRLTGADAALGLMLDGKTVTADRALAMGLVDQVVDADPVARAIADLSFGVVRPSLALPVPADCADAASKHARPKAPAAQAHMLDLVGALPDMTPEAGLAAEAAAFAALLQSPESRALRHVFAGRRIVGRIPGLDLKAHPPRSVDGVTIIGGGLMGTGIAAAVVNAGLRAWVIEPDAARRAKLAATIGGYIDRDVAKGRIGRDVGETRKALLTADGDLGTSEGRSARLFIEAVFEDMAVKRDVFTALDRIAPPDAILASNTSTLDLDKIAAMTSRPQSVVGLHFFSPANVMKLLEVVRGAQTAPAVLSTALAFARTLGKTAVVAGVCDGFIGNRIFEEYLRQVWLLLEEGALPEQIDRAMEAFGMAMGPCRVMDLAGQDIGWNIRKRRKVDQPSRPYSNIPDLICEMGRFGQKTGAGIYLYPDGRTAQVDPMIETLIVEESRRLGLERRVVGDAEIVERCVLAMANEGARLLTENIAYRPVDIDIVYLDGYGFPATRGGPMYHADRLGLANVLETVRRYAAGRQGWAWEPAPLLLELAGRGGRFADLNAR